MSIVGKLLKLTIDVAMLPVDIVADVVTMGDGETLKGNSGIFEMKSSTVKKLKAVYQDIENL